jgi:hypothetical protein
MAHTKAAIGGKDDPLFGKELFARMRAVGSKAQQIADGAATPELKLLGIASLLWPQIDRLGFSGALDYHGKRLNWVGIVATYFDWQGHAPFAEFEDYTDRWRIEVLLKDIARAKSGKQFAWPNRREQSRKSRKARYLGEKKIAIDDDQPIIVSESFDHVLKGLIELGRIADTAQLKEQSGKDDFARVLREGIKRQPRLKPFFAFPGKKNHGGYRTTIRDGRKATRQNRA